MIIPPILGVQYWGYISSGGTGFLWFSAGDEEETPKTDAPHRMEDAAPARAAEKRTICTKMPKYN